MISWIYFSWNLGLGNYSLLSVSCRFCTTQEELELLTIICDFITQLFVISRHGSSIESDFGMRFATRSFDLAFHDFAFFKHSFYCTNRSLKGVSYLLILWLRKTKFLYPWSVILYFFFVCEPCQRPPAPIRLSIHKSNFKHNISGAS